jgi:hypothetical protein
MHFIFEIKKEISYDVVIVLELFMIFFSWKNCIKFNRVEEFTNNQGFQVFLSRVEKYEIKYQKVCIEIFSRFFFDVGPWLWGTIDFFF